jgi:molybdopterin/thiamine biosynthesis adenylyltransferase
VGALGSSLAETMARAGVCSLVVADRDYVEESNLQRQSLFDEEDAARGLPKAVAAERRLRRINSEVAVQGQVVDVSSENVAALVAAADLVLDGTDNFETRFLLNDACVEARVPWIYGACVGAHGLALAVQPGISPCLRCVLDGTPAPGASATCDTAGVVLPIVQAVAGIQGAEALKLLAGRTEALLPGLVTLDLWSGELDVLDLRGRAPWCPACTAGTYEHRAAGGRGITSVLCGRGAVQLRPPAGRHLDLAALAERLARAGRVTSNEYLVKFVSSEAEIVVFADGRAIVKGAGDAARARSLYARYVGA